MTTSTRVHEIEGECAGEIEDDIEGEIDEGEINDDIDEGEINDDIDTSKLRQLHVEGSELGALSCDHVGDDTVAKLGLAHVRVDSLPNIGPKADSIVDELPESRFLNERERGSLLDHEVRDCPIKHGGPPAGE